MFNLADQTFHIQPKVMSDEVIDAAFDWIRGYCEERGLRHFHVSIHGGEPLLAGVHRIRRVVDSRNRIERTAGLDISLSLLTNGLLLSQEWLDLFHSEGIHFGISLDGPVEYHDRFRLDNDGKGTHAIVEAMVRWILSTPKGLHNFSGVLCVVHPDMDGRRLVRYFYDLGIHKLDLLLPDQNHAYPGICYPPPGGSPIYGRVLSEAYTAWRELDDPTFQIRKFAMMIAALFGRVPSLDSLGTGPITVFTIETNGEVEPVDTMKACGDGFTKSGIDIRNVRGSEVEALPLIALGLKKIATLPLACTQCEHLPICGGGYLPHRFGGGGTFRETVYCADMMELGTTIRRDLRAQLLNARSKN
jgi:uncharacterized protein